MSRLFKTIYFVNKLQNPLCSLVTIATASSTPINKGLPCLVQYILLGSSLYKTAIPHVPVSCSVVFSMASITLDDSSK